MPLTAANSLDIRKPPAATRVVVAMSGGVDSSVVAGLLKRQGYDVVGITLQLYDHGAAAGRKGACCAGRDIHDARRVAAQLGIPHYVLDYQARFQSKVIDRFAQSYAAGETPIPCVACNSDVKFADLLETARDLGADVLATGHYVASRALLGGGRGLYRAADVARDQSYFLFATTPAQLGILRFPLGNLPKAEVRALARDFGLPVAEKPDSQDICFVPSGKYGDVIERVAPAAAVPGDIRHIDGRFLGRHAGIIRYTIGQRRGLGLGGFGGEPIYVVALDAATATVLVGPRSALATQSVHLRDLNWIGDGAARNAAAEGLPLFVRVRSTRPPAAATLHIEGGDAWIAFAQDEDAVAPGQACVFYESDAPGARILGGGFIRATERRAARAPVRLPETVGI